MQVQTDTESTETVSEDTLSQSTTSEGTADESAATTGTESPGMGAASSEAASVEQAPAEAAPDGDGSAKTEQPVDETLGTRAEVEVLGDCKRRITASVPVEKVREELDRNYKELASTVQLPGFRKGRIPRPLLESRFGKEIESDVKQSLLSVSLSEVIEAQKLDVVGSPTVTEVELKRDADMTYVVELEVRPEFELPQYKAIEVSREAVPVKEEDVEERLQALRRKAAKLEPVDLAQAGADSVYIGKYTLFRDAVKVKGGVDVSFLPVSKVLGPFFVEDLEERVKTWNISAGEPLKLTVRVPADYSDEVLRGKEAELEFVLEETRKSVLPELNDDFAKSLEKGSLDEVRADIRKSLEELARRDSDRKVEARILEKILGSTTLALPEGLVAGMVSRRRLEREYELLERGMPPEEVKATLVREWGAEQESPQGEAGETASTEPAPGGPESAPQPAAAASEEIRREIKEYFVLERIASNEKIYATEEEVDKRVYLMATMYGIPPGRLLEELRSSGRLEGLRTSLRSEKVRAFLRKEARILGPDGQPEAAQA